MRVSCAVCLSIYLQSNTMQSYWANASNVNYGVRLNSCLHCCWLCIAPSAAPPAVQLVSSPLDARPLLSPAQRSRCPIHDAFLMPGAFATTSTASARASSRWAPSCRAAALRLVLFWTLLPCGAIPLELPSFDVDLALPRRRRGKPTDCSPPFMPLGASLRFRPASALLGRALSSTSSSLAGSPAAGSARRAAATSSSSSSLPPTCAATPWGPGASAASHRRSPACSAGAAGMSSSSASAAAGAAAEAASLAAPASSPPGNEILDGPEAAAGNGGPALATLETLKFDNTFTAELPGDSSESNVPRQVRGFQGAHVLPGWPAKQPCKHSRLFLAGLAS